MIPHQPHSTNVPCGSTPVEGERPAGLWTGAITKGDKTVGASGLVYYATCKQCGADLEASLTKEDEKAREFIWSEREAKTERRNEQSDRKAALEPLLRNHEKRAEVTKCLTLDFIDYSADGERRSESQKWLFFDEVAAADKQFPGILFHMSRETMTWLFFDDEEKLQGYFVRSA
jgi:hypothetical protein